MDKERTTFRERIDTEEYLDEESSANLPERTNYNLGTVYHTEGEIIDRRTEIKNRLREFLEEIAEEYGEPNLTEDENFCLASIISYIEEKFPDGASRERLTLALLREKILMLRDK